jgi:RNA polymerase-interacting CarD/CdnL/TRCF family regulator
VVNLVEKTEGVEQTVKEGWLMPLGINLLVRNGSSTQNIDFGTFQVDRQATTLLDDTVVRTRREKQLERTSEAESQLNQTRLSQKACSDFFNTINQLDKDQKLRGLSPVEKQALSSDYKLIQDHVAAINPELDKMLVAILRFRPQTLGRAYSNHRTDAPNIKLWDKTMMSALSLIYSDNYFGPEYEATKAEERGNPRKLLADNENAIRIAVKQDVTNAQTRVDLVTETMRSSDKTQFFRTINRLASEHGNKPINELPEADRNAINKAFTPFRVHLNILESTKQDMKALALSERLDQALMSPNANQNRPVTIDELMAFKPLIEEHYSTIKTPVGAGNLQARPLLAEPLSIVENPRSNKSFLTRIADQHFAEYLEDKVTNDLAGSLESYLHPSVYKQLDFTPPASNSPSLVTKALGYSPINEALELKIAGVSETAKPYQILIDSIWLLRDMSASYEAMAKDSSNKKVSTREKAAHLVELAKLGYFLNNNAQQILRIVDKMPERLKHLVQHDINRVFDEIGMNPIEQGLNQEPPSEADLQFGQDIFNAILNLSVDATSLERITEEPSVQEKLRLIVQKPNELQTLLLEISNITKSVASNPRALKTIRNELVGTLLECSANVEHSLGINDSPISDEIVKHFDNLYSELAKEALDEEEALELVHGDHFITQRQLAVEEHRLASIELSLEALEPKTELHLQQFESFVNGIDYLQHIKQTTHQVPDEPAFKGLDKWSGLQVVKIQAIAIETLIDQEARTQQTNHAICQDRISLLQERLHEQQTEYKANVIPQINAARIEKAAKHERANELEDIGFNKALGLIKEGSKQLRVNGNVEAHLEAEKLYDVLNQNKKEYIEGRLDKQAFATNCQKATDSAEQGELGKVPMFKQVLSFIANVIISFCTIFSLLGKDEFEVVKPSSPKDTLNIHDMKKAMKSLHEQAHSTDEPLQDNHELDSENNPIDSENSLPQGEESLDEVESIHP